MATLLIVEDELVLARNLSKAFVRQGFEVHHATGIAEGRKIAATTPVDVALLDLRLPDGSGLDLLDALVAADRIGNRSVGGHHDHGPVGVGGDQRGEQIESAAVR